MAYVTVVYIVMAHIDLYIDALAIALRGSEEGAHRKSRSWPCVVMAYHLLPSVCVAKHRCGRRRQALRELVVGPRRLAQCAVPI